MSNTPSPSFGLVAKDAPPRMPTSSEADSPFPLAPNHLLKDARVPQSPGSDEGFGSGFFAQTSSATSSSTLSSATSSATSSSSQKPAWNGNFRSRLSIDSQNPVPLTPGRRNHRQKSPPSVTICPAPTPSFMPFLPSEPSSFNSFSTETESALSTLGPLPTASSKTDADSLAVTNDSGAIVEEKTPVHSDRESQIEVDDEKEIEESQIDYFQVDEDLCTPLHVAVLDDVDASFFLISKAESPAQLNLHNKFGSSPIHLAAKVGNSDSLRDLILGGANVEERDVKGETALHIACRRGHYESVRCLTTPLSMDDQVITNYKPPYQRLPQRLDVVNYEGLTCLHLAAFHRHKNIMKELVRLGADVDAPDSKSGRTPLHFAVERKDTEIVRFLLEKSKADVDAETFDGATPLCLAEGRGFHSMATLLKGYGADSAKGIQAWRQQEESDYGSDFDSTESP